MLTSASSIKEGGTMFKSARAASAASRVCTAAHMSNSACFDITSSRKEKKALSNDRPVMRHTPRPVLLPTQLLSRSRKQPQPRCDPCRRSSVRKHTPWPMRGDYILRTAIDNAISRQFNIFLTGYQAHRESGTLLGKRRGGGKGWEDRGASEGNSMNVKSNYEIWSQLCGHNPLYFPPAPPAAACDLVETAARSS